MQTASLEHARGGSTTASERTYDDGSHESAQHDASQSRVVASDAPASATEGVPYSARFAFGRNWQRLLRSGLSEERVVAAAESLTAFLDPTGVEGHYFLDVGCGSGLFSLAAHRLGATRIVSFDVDPDSVECCRELHRRAGSPVSWEIRLGSALDAAFLATLAPADIVYSWGVLHHTGRMWDAVELTARLVRQGGVFHLGLYNHLEGKHGSSYWLGVKQRYNRASAPRRRIKELAFVLRRTVLPNLRRGINPLRIMREYRGRGMTYYTDVLDWLGGLPYEVSTPGEVLRRFRRWGFVLENVRTTNGWGVNEYLFRAPS